MSIKVTAASNDGKHVNQHFGKAQKFLIFEIKENGKYQFIELRETDPRCGGDPDLKEKTINLISDCDILLMSQIGLGAQKKLLNRGVRPLIMPCFYRRCSGKVYSLIQND